MATTKKWTASTFTSRLHESLTREGVKVKRSTLNAAVTDTFEAAVKSAAGGQRVRFPVLGALTWREVKARKAGWGTNPFTGERIMVKARPASGKPRWSFSKWVRETFARPLRKAA